MNPYDLPKTDFLFVRLLFQKIGKLKIIGLSLSLMIGQALYIFLPALLGVLINAIFVKADLGISWLFLFPLVWLLSFVFMTVAQYIISIITQDVRKFSKEIVFEYLVRLPSRVYSDRGAGEIESFMQELSFNARYMFAESFPFFIRVIVSIIASIVTVWYSSAWLSLIFVGWFLLYVPISYIIAKHSMSYVAHSLVSSAEVSSSTVDIIENHELIPTFGTENFEISRFHNLLVKERKAYVTSQLGIDKANLWQQLLQMILPLGIVLFVTSTHFGSTASPGAIVTLFMVALVVINQIGDFGRGILAFFEVKERMKTALDKFAALHNSSQESIPQGNKKPTSFNVAFEKACFMYDVNHTAIRDVSFEIKEGEKVGLIGYSGSGKTTLMKMLRGFYKPASGYVSLGGVQVQEIQPKFLAEHISEVSQTIPLFHRSLRENLAYGSPNVTDEEIWHILERAQLSSYAKKLPDGLNTVIGVKGRKLSGGERARIAIARAFLKNSKIIILDEATSSLDSESEHLIHESLQELMKGRTVIAIAHRLSTLRSMDRILVLDKGEIAASGTHDDLMRKNDLYKRLWNMQVLV